MSFSKIAQNCAFCDIGKGIYNCPRCKKRYCSSYCYKRKEHEDCSESFYREWVETSLRSQNSSKISKEDMMMKLKNFNEESEATSGASLEDRFSSIDINQVDEMEIWQALNVEEREGFKNFISNQQNLETIMQVKQPWWTETSLNLIVEDDFNEKNCDNATAVRPPYPLGSKKMSELTTKPPSDCVKYNLFNILYCYAFLSRFYNCDLRDFTEEVVKSFFELSPVLKENINYSNLEESIQDSIRLIANSDFQIPMAFIKNIANDVANMLRGPTNARPATFVACALHDIKLLFMEFKHAAKMDKSYRHKIVTTVKKLEYYISWSLEYEDGFNDFASNIIVTMFSDMIPEPMPNVKSESQGEKEKKVLVEEVK